MPKVKLDSLFCSTAACPPGKKKVDYWDTLISGFVLEVRASGTATYALRYIDQSGTQRQRRIGSRSAISNDQARKAARKLRSEIELGGNPQAERQLQKKIPRYADLARQHVEHARQTLRSHANTAVIQRKYLVPRFGKARICDITPQQIEKLLAELRESLAPASVERIRTCMHRAYVLAAKWGLPGADRNPAVAVERPRFDNRREKFLTAAQADRLIKACAESSNPMLRPICELLLLCGSRKRELLDAKWEHIDIERRSWLIPYSKNGSSRRVPLSQAALDVISKLPRYEGCSWLVPNPETLQPFDNIKRSWATACKVAGLEGLRIHDLRHSFCSFAISAGTDLFTVGKIVGHKDYQSTMRYSHLANDHLLAAVEAGAAKMQGGQP